MFDNFFLYIGIFFYLQKNAFIPHEFVPKKYNFFFIRSIKAFIEHPKKI